ncbi:hypothetical protein DFP72DRAFT_1043735 [Ephemerocybe angulata]|uniref:Uncharacterized protein n=1 Tax=Ephemerocybe angulata TaxID=980116 RepID=A0A8H6I509_9AGAR|nr:hypothetical protein DFP72DRAFT_1043735 [Tulosesus angulatus]
MEPTYPPASFRSRGTTLLNLQAFLLEAPLRKSWSPDVPVDIESLFDDQDHDNHTPLARPSTLPIITGHREGRDPAWDSKEYRVYNSPTSSDTPSFESLSSSLGDRMKNDSDAEISSLYSSDDWELSSSCPTPDAYSVTHSQSTSTIMSQLSEFSFKIRKLPRVEATAMPQALNHNEQAPRQYFSEVDIETNASIFMHRYLVIRDDFATGPRRLHRGEDGHLHLKPFAAIQASHQRTHGFVPPNLLPSYRKFERFSVLEDWDSPTLCIRACFAEHATLVFAERAGMYTKSGDPLYEFLGSFYVRKLGGPLKEGNKLTQHDDLGVTILRGLAEKGATVAAPPVSASLVLFQYIDERKLV